jgi:hypothetical protein
MADLYGPEAAAEMLQKQSVNETPVILKTEKS